MGEYNGEGGRRDACQEEAVYGLVPYSSESHQGGLCLGSLGIPEGSP